MRAADPGWTHYPAFSTLTPPSPDWVVPLQNAMYAPSLIVLDVARRK